MPVPHPRSSFTPFPPEWWHDAPDVWTRERHDDVERVFTRLWQETAGVFGHAAAAKLDIVDVARFLRARVGGC